MKAIRLILSFTLCGSLIVSGTLAQTILTAYGTGRTTGHIADLNIQNELGKDINFKVTVFFIPSDGKYQPYISSAQPTVLVHPYSTVTIPLEGYCADIHLPPVPDGEAMPPFETWITPETAGAAPAPDFIPEVGSPFQAVNEMEETPFPITFAGTNVPFPYTIDFNKNPTEAAPILFDVLEAITHTVEQMYVNGSVPVTPFSSNPTKEKEALIQQTFWIYTSQLNPADEDYVKTDFAKQTYEQFKTSTQMEVTAAPPAVKEQIDLGIADFWNAFTAVGVEAKIIRQTEPESSPPAIEEGIIEVMECQCRTCEIVRPFRFFNLITNEEITSDSIPWYNDRIRFDPPVVQSDCPTDCHPSSTVRNRRVPNYRNHFHSPSLWLDGSFETTVSDKGDILFETSYSCFCDGKTCGEGLVSKRIYFTESNDCCDRVRDQNNGNLRFNFNQGNVHIAGNQLILHIEPDTYETFHFDFNLEAIFCNLEGDQVFGYLQSLSQQSSSNEQVREFFSSSDLSLGHPANEENVSPHYSLVFSKTVNGKEVLVSIVLDEESCVFDVQVLYGDEVYEYAGPPYLTVDQLWSMANQMGNANQAWFWNQAMVILSHLLRADQHGRAGTYRNAFRNFLSQLSTGAHRLLDETTNPVQRAELQALIDSIRDALTSGDFNQLENVLQKMLPIFNRIW